MMRRTPHSVVRSFGAAAGTVTSPPQTTYTGLITTISSEPIMCGGTHEGERPPGTLAFMTCWFVERDEAQVRDQRADERERADRSTDDAADGLRPSSVERAGRASAEQRAQTAEQAAAENHDVPHDADDDRELGPLLRVGRGGLSTRVV